MSAGWRQRFQRWLGAPSQGSSVEGQPKPAGAMEQPDVTGLEKQVGKLGREQFKLNALLEAQQQQVQAALQQLREQGERRDQERAGLLANRRAELVEARMQVVQRLLPVLDGLDEALASGERLLARLPPPAQVRAIPPQPSGTPARWAVALAVPVVWLRSLLGVRWAPPSRQPIAARQPTGEGSPSEGNEWREAYAGWLRGLHLVRDRLLETLAVEGVHPMWALGQPFDPRRHVVLDTAAPSPDAPPGTVVAETRRGYMAGDRVVRYAEVIVARE